MPVLYLHGGLSCAGNLPSLAVGELFYIQIINDEKNSFQAFEILAITLILWQDELTLMTSFIKTILRRKTVRTTPQESKKVINLAIS